MLAADETPVNVLDKTPLPVRRRTRPRGGPGGEGRQARGRGAARADRPHPGRAADVPACPGVPAEESVGGGIPAAFTGYLMTDGYTGYQHLLDRIAGIQQCVQHAIRRARAVQKLGPGGVQDWAADIITILGQAHRAVEDTRARGSTALDPQVLDALRERYDAAVYSGTGPQPAPGLARREPPRIRPGPAGCRGYKEQVFLFTRDLAVDWTNNVSERGAKAAKRHQAVSGYWHSLATLARWCRIKSYLDSAAAHGTGGLDAIRGAIEGKPWLPPMPAISLTRIPGTP